MRWRNWSGAQTAEPAQFVQPTTEAEVVELVRRAAGDGLRVKAVGAGHSFTPVAATDGVLVNLDHLSGVVTVDREAMVVTFLAGTRLRDIPGLLRPHGLALANQGDVGPGDPLFDLGRVSLGALGVTTRITMAVVESFVLSAVEKAEPVAPLARDFPARAAAVDHLEYYWFPGTDVAHVKTNTRYSQADAAAADLPGPVPRWRSVIDDEVVSNGAFGAMCTLMHLAPRTTGAMNRVAAATLAQREYADTAHNVFVSPRRVRFNEMEYAVPLADAPEVLSEVHRVIDASGVPVGFPVEVRCTAADTVPLSTAYGRESCYIAVHRYHRDDYRELFSVVEPVLTAAGGRPHWGKLHTLDHADLAAVHPHLSEVAELRARVDPDGVFRNPMVDRVFGI